MKYWLVLVCFIAAAGCARKEEDVFRSADLRPGLVAPKGSLFVPTDETATDYSIGLEPDI